MRVTYAAVIETTTKRYEVTNIDPGMFNTLLNTTEGFIGFHEAKEISKDRVVGMHDTLILNKKYIIGLEIFETE